MAAAMVSAAIKETICILKYVRLLHSFPSSSFCPGSNLCGLCGLSSKAHYMLLQACLTKNRKETVVISQTQCLLHYAESLFYLTVIEK